MTRTRRWLVGTGLFMVISTGAIIAIDAFGWLDFEPVIEVTVAPVSRATVVARLWAEGKVASAHAVTLSAAGSGQLVALAVAEGDTVQQGQLLMRIEASSLTARATAAQHTLKSKRAQIAQATALSQQQAESAAQATRDWQRQAILYSQGVISGKAYEEARALYGAAIAKAREAENQLQAMRSAAQVAASQMSQAAGNLRETTIYAPFSGVVSRLHVTRGQHVVGTSMAAGTPLLDLF